MSNQTFFGSLKDFRGITPEPQKSKLQDRAEDVEFEEIKGSEHSQPKIDSRTREFRMMEAAEAATKGISAQIPLAGIAMKGLFLIGAMWADKHPVSNYADRSGWMDDMGNEIKSINDRTRKSSGEFDPVIELITSSYFTKGAFWAIDNPATSI